MSVEQAWEWLGFAFVTGLAVIALVGAVVAVVIAWREL